MTENNTQYRFDSVDIIIYLWNKRLPIILLTGLAAILSIIASLIIDDKYKSEVIIFPTASGSISQDLLSATASEKNILQFGEDEEVEQLLQILNSDFIRERIVENFDLMNHYEIKSAYPIYTLNKTFSENIKFVPTKFMSVNITVLDKEPKVAADIANKITDLVDTVFYNMRINKAREGLKLVEYEYEALKAEMSLIEDSIAGMRKKGVVNFNAQAERYAEAYGNALIEGKNEAASKLQDKLDLLAKYGGTNNLLADRLYVLQRQIGILNGKRAEARLDVSQNLSKIYVVNKAIVAEKKSYPVRWLIVVASTFSAFILSILLLVIHDAVVKRAAEIKDQL